MLINARLAGDALGATKMDRPEWTAINPKTGEIYLTLTNNIVAHAGQHRSPPTRATITIPRVRHPQLGNPNGHIIRLRETGDDPEAVTFTWDIYPVRCGI